MDKVIGDWVSITESSVTKQGQNQNRDKIKTVKSRSVKFGALAQLHY